jgi:hypothetical protein
MQGVWVLFVGLVLPRFDIIPPEMRSQSCHKPYLLGRRWPDKLVNVRKPILMSECLELVHPVLIIRSLGEFQSSAIPKEFFEL